MELSLIAGTASSRLGACVAEKLGVSLARGEVARFADQELHVEVLDTVRGRDVYIIQATSPPADRHLLELLLLADACRRGGAARLTAVVPYFGYARQDRRAKGREAVAARLISDLMQASGLERIIALDVHTPAIESIAGIPVEHVSAVPSLIERVLPLCGETTTIVAPDLGAVHLAEGFAQALGLPVAVVHKTRVSGEEVRASRVTGNVSGRAPIIVDDMISTGGTIEAAYHALPAAGCQTNLVIAATHGLFVGRAVERLRSLPARRIIVSDSIGRDGQSLLPLDQVSVAGLLAEVICGLNQDRSLAGLLAHR